MPARRHPTLGLTNAAAAPPKKLPRRGDSGRARNVPAITVHNFFFRVSFHFILSHRFTFSRSFLAAIILFSTPFDSATLSNTLFQTTPPQKLFTMSTESNVESQFQKPGDLVERDEDTGVMQVESLCMNCHENVSFWRLLI